MNTADAFALGTIARDGHTASAGNSADDTRRSRRYGEFRYFFDDGRWEWSPEVALLHGYRPGTVAPGIFLVLSHVCPDDYRHVAATLDTARRNHRPFVSCHRILDTDSHLHNVVVVGLPFSDAAGTIVGMHGVFIDITPIIGVPDGAFADRKEWIRAATQC